jgi:hypothetical protein
MERIFELRLAAGVVAEGGESGPALRHLVVRRLLPGTPAQFPDPIDVTFFPSEEDLPDVVFAAGAVPVVRPEVGELFRRIAGSDVEVLRARSMVTQRMFSVIDTLVVLDALDRERSVFDLRPEGDWDPLRGPFAGVYETVISARAARGHKVFRIFGLSLSAVFVTEPLAEALQGVTGISLFECGAP